MRKNLQTGLLTVLTFGSVFHFGQCEPFTPLTNIATFAGKTYEKQTPQGIKKTQPKSETTISDPLEPLNRGIFEFNLALDAIFFDPISQVYHFVLPTVVQDRVHNVLENLKTPLTFMNDVVQLEGDRAMASLARFTINSTVGLFGLFDVAKEMGIEPHTEDFGQTLGTYGVPSGPYLMLPILGPSNLRDLAGLTVDTITEPANYASRKFITPDARSRGAIYIRTGTEVIDYRVRSDEFLKDLKKQMDPYATLRSVHHQHRKFSIQNEVESNDDTPRPDQD